MKNPPQYLRDAYAASRFPSMNLSLCDFVMHQYVVYKLAPSREPKLSLDDWMDGYDWEGVVQENSHEHQ